MLVGWRQIIHTARQAGRNRVRKGHGTLFFGPTDGGGGHLLLLIIRSPLAHGAPPHQPRTPPSRSFVPIRSFASKAPSHPRPRASLLSLSLSRPRVRLPPRDTARSVRRGGGGGRSRVGGGRGWPPRTAAAAATRRGTQRPRRRCGTLHLRRELAAAIWRRTSGSSAASACELRRAFSLFFFLRPCCSDLCRRMSRRSPFVDWTFVLRDYAPSLLIQCNSPLIFVVDIFFFASILCSIHCAVPKFLRSDIKLRYC